MLSSVWKSTGVTMVIRLRILSGMQRRIAQRERAALADAEQVDRVEAVRAAQVVDRAAEEAFDVVLEREVAVGTIRIAPVDDVDVLAAREQAACTIERSACRSTMYGRLTSA